MYVCPCSTADWMFSVCAALIAVRRAGRARDEKTHFGHPLNDEMINIYKHKSNRKNLHLIEFKYIISGYEMVWLHALHHPQPYVCRCVIICKLNKSFENNFSIFVP